MLLLLFDNVIIAGNMDLLLFALEKYEEKGPFWIILEIVLVWPIKKKYV